eukprot:5838883-Amphidinium_carterae.1
MAGVALFAAHASQIIARWFGGSESPLFEEEVNSTSWSATESTDEAVRSSHIQAFLLRVWSNLLNFVFWNALPFNKHGLVGFLVHRMGSWAFGSRWFYVQLICAVLTGVLLFYCIGNVLGAVALGLDVLVVRPIHFVLRIIKALVFLPRKPEIAGNVDMRGPHGSAPSDNAFLKTIRGRDQQGKPYQCLAVLDGEVVPLWSGLASWTHTQDAWHGFSFHQCSCHKFSQGAQSAGRLCRCEVSEEKLVDLAEKFTVPTWWQYKPPLKASLEILWKVLRHVPLVAKLFYWLFQSGRGGLAAWHANPGPDSESETDHEENVCIAHRILLGADGQGRSLCDRPCPNRAADDWVPLLEEDFETSRLPEEAHQHGQVKLCRHHWQAYKSTRHTRKCARLSWRLSTNQIDNVPLCEEHARSGDLLAPLRTSAGASEGETSNARQRLLNVVAQRQQNAPTEWNPGGADLLALVLCEDGSYFAFNATTEGGPFGWREAFYFSVPALDVQLEVPAELGPIKEKAILTAAMEMQAPILCITSRRAVAVEGQGLCGKSLDESAFQRLKTKVRNLGSTHPLVTVVSSERSVKISANTEEPKAALQTLPPLTDRLVARVLQARRRHSCGLDAAEEFQSELGMDDLGEVCDVLARR